MTYFVDDIVIYLKKKKDNKQLLYKLALIWKHFKRVSYVAEVWKLNIPKHFFFFFLFSGMISKRWISCDSPHEAPASPSVSRFVVVWFHFCFKRLSICTNNARLWRALRFIFLPWGLEEDFSVKKRPSLFQFCAYMLHVARFICALPKRPHS